MGEGVLTQDVQACVPGQSVRAEVDYANGRTVLWTLALDPATGDLAGKFRQDDGARGLFEER